MRSIPILMVDAGTGNLHSVYQTLKLLTDEIIISDKPEDIKNADRVILPGVGAFAGFIQGLLAKELTNPICEFIQSGKPILGICVGMQALFDLSEENGSHAGLSVLPGSVKKFEHLEKLKIPHTGWNQLWFEIRNQLLQKIEPGDYVYFNHSYYCAPKNKYDITAFTDYGIDFCSMVTRNNIFGVQFHPEKSHKIGLQILSNFLNTKGI
jgi:glutamine amidotransferase